MAGHADDEVTSPRTGSAAPAGTPNSANGSQRGRAAPAGA